MDLNIANGSREKKTVDCIRRSQQNLNATLCSIIDFVVFVSFAFGSGVHHFFIHTLSTDILYRAVLVRFHAKTPDKWHEKARGNKEINVTT